MLDGLPQLTSPVLAGAAAGAVDSSAAEGEGGGRVERAVEVQGRAEEDAGDREEEEGGGGRALAGGGGGGCGRVERGCHRCRQDLLLASQLTPLSVATSLWGLRSQQCEGKEEEEEEEEEEDDPEDSAGVLVQLLFMTTLLVLEIWTSCSCSSVFVCCL